MRRARPTGSKRGRARIGRSQRDFILQLLCSYYHEAGKQDEQNTAGTAETKGEGEVAAAGSKAGGEDTGGARGDTGDGRGGRRGGEEQVREGRGGEGQLQGGTELCARRSGREDDNWDQEGMHEAGG